MTEYEYLWNAPMYTSRLRTKPRWHAAAAPVLLLAAGGVERWKEALRRQHRANPSLGQMAVPTRKQPVPAPALR